MPRFPTFRTQRRWRGAPIVALIAALPACSSPARADCIDDAALHHRVDATVLRAIGWQESRLNPSAVGKNRNGTVDLGAFQINSVHLPELRRYGITDAALADGCISAYVAGWHYRHQIDRLGNTWAAVGAYHSTTPSRGAWYANQIAAVLTHWHVLPPGPPPYLHATPPPAVETTTPVAPPDSFPSAFILPTQ